MQILEEADDGGDSSQDICGVFDALCASLMQSAALGRLLIVRVLESLVPKRLWKQSPETKASAAPREDVARGVASREATAQASTAKKKAESRSVLSSIGFFLPPRVTFSLPPQQPRSAKPDVRMPAARSAANSLPRDAAGIKSSAKLGVPPQHDNRYKELSDRELLETCMRNGQKLPLSDEAMAVIRSTAPTEPKAGEPKTEHVAAYAPGVGDDDITRFIHEACEPKENESVDPSYRKRIEAEMAAVYLRSGCMGCALRLKPPRKREAH